MLDLIGKYMDVSYGNAVKLRISPSDDVEITSLSKLNAEEPEDHYIVKYTVLGKTQYNILPSVLNDLKGMFGKRKDLKKLVEMWFDSKEVDEQV
jgi:hypothetical protein